MKSKTVTISRTLKVLAITAFCFNFGAVSPTASMLGGAASAQESKAQKLQRFRPIFDKANSKKSLHQTNAAKYDSAIRNIGALEQAPLKTEADVKKAIDILQRNEIDNSMLLGKGFMLAINVSSFKAGVEAEAKRVSSKGFATQMKSKSLSLSRIGGFNDLKATFKRQFDGDAAMLKRVGARLQQASKQKGISFSSPSSAPKPGMFATSFLGEKSRSNPFIAAGASCSRPTDIPGASPTRTESLNGEPLQLDPITVSILGGVALAAVAYLITVYAYEKEDDFDEDPETGVSQLGKCQDDARDDRKRRLRNHEGDFFGQAGCWAEWTVDEAACLLLPL